MRKLTTLNAEQLKKFSKLQRKQKFLSNLGILFNGKYAVGDTCAKIPNGKLGDVFVTEWNGKEWFYVVISEIDENLAFCYSLYPTVG